MLVASLAASQQSTFQLCDTYSDVNKVKISITITNFPVI